MITFIVTYDLAETESRPDVNERFKEVLFHKFNGLSLEGQEFQRNSHIESLRFKQEGYDLPSSTFLINAYDENLTPKNIADFIFNTIKPMKILIGKLYIDITNTNGSHTPYVFKLNNLFGG